MKKSSNKTIKESIEVLIEEDKSKKLELIWETSLKIINDVKSHTKEITTQLSQFDIHDEKHSEAVLDIIEHLLGEKIKNLSFYELLLIYMCSYMHDAAMALPSWEYKLLKAIEGTEEFYDSTLDFKIQNDFKPVHKYSEAIDIINENKAILYGDFENRKGYVFIENNEEDLMNNLATLICEYEEFRNGYIEELEKNKTSVSQYINYSKIIRSEYIRSTHHVRIENYIKRIKEKYINCMGSLCAEKFVDDLGIICRSHGEDIQYIYNLDLKREIDNHLIANIQFIAILLRLGDVMHFSSDRAPMSLFAEKNIHNEESMVHWKSKFQELKYSFYNQNGHIYIKYSAYCSWPNVYYFIQNYMDCIDYEINNYYSIKNKWEYDNLEHIENYIIDIGNKVDRKDVMYDKNKFIPNNMKFTLNQSKILELLMGIQLYKDEYLCLREIYQNALDASKCILAYNETKGITEDIFIEFGLGEDIINENKYKYIYCLDKGIGMNEHIINQYLLNIGNSYYKSKDFRKNNVRWNQNVKPISQFGIGLLSGYMIADKIGITTKYYERESKLINLILEGANENSYYIKPNRIDDEKIGLHGTIIKLYLKEDIANKLNNCKINKLPLLLMEKNDKFIQKFINVNKYKNNLKFLISKNIGIENKNIPVYIVEENNSRERMLSSSSIFDYNKYPDIQEEDIRKLWSRYYYVDDGLLNPYNEYINKNEYIENYLIEINTESLQVYSHISFPKKGIDSDNLKLYRYCNFIGNNEGKIFIDGVFVGEKQMLQYSKEENILGRDIVERSIFNFIGEKRPLLSVDRNSIISMPNIDDELKIVKEEYINKIVYLICDHIKNNQININDNEMNIILDILTKEFPTIVYNILKNLSETQVSQLVLAKEIWNNVGIKLNDLFKCNDIEINNCDFRQYKEVNRQLILRKSICAEKIEVENNTIKITSQKFMDLPVQGYYNTMDISLTSVAISADKWEGKFSEYDLVSNLWPIVSPSLYKCLRDEVYVEEIVENRSKTISDCENAIQAIAKLDPVLINPKIGIYKKDTIHEKKENYVGEFEKILKNFWLFELNNHGDNKDDKKRNNVLFAYIAPRKLNSKEEKRLKEYDEKESDYVKGIREGWSILFLGKIQKYIILPGICKKKELIKNIPQSYIEETGDTIYYNTDGTKLFT